MFYIYENNVYVLYHKKISCIDKQKNPCYKISLCFPALTSIKYNLYMYMHIHTHNGGKKKKKKSANVI